jgi:hypothetical protein
MKPASRLIALIALALIHAASRQASPDTYKLLGHEAKATGSPEGAKCLTTDITGRIDPMGKYVAQCTGRFADYYVRPVCALWHDHCSRLLIAAKFCIPKLSVRTLP